MTQRELTQEDIALYADEARRKASGEDPRLKQNYLFERLYDAERGHYTRKAFTRHAWIESNFTIKPKNRPLELLVANQTQRRLEAMILRMERARMPVRIATLKARQEGISTYAQAIMFEVILREKNAKGAIVADTDDRAEMLLGIANTARRNMPKDDGECWDFKMRSKAAYQLVWDAPIDGSITITSAETGGAGRGGTLRICHLSEVAFWKEASVTAAGLLESVPDMPGTIAIAESTANGDSGWFRDIFWKAWEERHVPLLERKSPWVAMFFPWWEHDEYRWTNTFGGGRALPDALVEEIKRTLSEEEEWLLKQSYFTRRKGWQRVDFDQLAWRRKKIVDFEEKGGLTFFNQEYPSRPEVAFMATGSKVFDPEKLQAKIRAARGPLWRGSLDEHSAIAANAAVFGDQTFEPPESES